MKRLIYFLLALLGFGSTGCEETSDARVEYGTPHVLFSLKARVINEAGDPIQGIEVRTKKGDSFYDRTGISDYLGNIDAHSSYMWPGAQYDVVFYDNDGALNGGEFETLELNIRDKVEQIKDGDGNWYSGSYRADLGDVTMILKNTTDEGNEEEENTEGE